MLDSPIREHLDTLQQAMIDGDFLVLTGAGISTPRVSPTTATATACDVAGNR